MNNIRILSCFAGFTVSMSLVANVPAERSVVPPATVDKGMTGATLRVIDPVGVTIPNAQITVRDEHGRAIVSGTTNQNGLFLLPPLAGDAYSFTISVAGFSSAEFQSLVPVDPGQTVEIEIAFKDPCYIDDQLNCEEFAKAPFFIDGFQKDSLMVIGPYPVSEKQPVRRPGFFKRLLSRLHHRQNGNQ